MVSPSEGSVVLVRFPFSDLSSSKLRPAVVIASVDRDDWTLRTALCASFLCGDFAGLSRLGSPPVIGDGYPGHAVVDIRAHHYVDNGRLP